MIIAIRASEIFEGIEGGYIGDERKIGSFIISYRFFGGGGVDCV